MVGPPFGFLKCYQYDTESFFECQENNTNIYKKNTYLLKRKSVKGLYT